jgi:hypothetical protein
MIGIGSLIVIIFAKLDGIYSITTANTPASDKAIDSEIIRFASVSVYSC